VVVVSPSDVVVVSTTGVVVVSSEPMVVVVVPGVVVVSGAGPQVTGSGRHMDDGVSKSLPDGHGGIRILFPVNCFISLQLSLFSLSFIVNARRSVAYPNDRRSKDCSLCHEVNEWEVLSLWLEIMKKNTS
jgi:hypothetical protein